LVAGQLATQRFERVRVWSRGVDQQRFHPRFRSAEMRRAMGAGPDDLVVAYVGRLAPEKGVRSALSAMRQARPLPGRNVCFALAGDGPDEARCREMAPEGTWFAGALRGDALSAFYASADVLIFPSTTETFGNVLLEAMASGVPVIAPDVGATLELAHTGTARLFRGGDATSLTAALDGLLADPAERDSLRAAGLTEAAKRSWDAVWDELLRDYREATA
jgi:glycosyltransferase involved in cell wall biosynthesis